MKREGRKCARGDGGGGGNGWGRRESRAGQEEKEGYKQAKGEWRTGVWVRDGHAESRGESQGQQGARESVV